MRSGIPKIRKYILRKPVPPAKPNRFAKVEDLEKKTSVIFRLIVTISSGLSFLLLLTILILDLYQDDNKITIHPFSVPDKFNKEGVYPESVAMAIEDQIQKIRATESVKNEDSGEKCIFDDQKAPVNLEFIGIKTKSDQVIEYAKKLLRIRTKDIQGELAIEDDSLRITVRTTGKASFARKEKIEEGKLYVALNTLVKAASMEILRQNEPLTIAYYYREDPVNFDTFIRALDEYEEVLTSKEDMARLYCAWGRNCAEKKEWEEAEEKYRTALAYDSLSSVLNRYGILLDDWGRKDSALAIYDRIIAREPDYFFAWYNRGITLKQQGTALKDKDSLQRKKKLEQAILSYQKARQLDPAHAKVVNNLGNAVFAATKDHDSSLVYYKEALRMDPFLAEAWTNMGLRYSQIGTNYEKKGDTLRYRAYKKKAISCYRRSLSLDPGKSITLNNLSNALLCMNDTASTGEAIVFIKQAVELKPNNGIYWNTLGEAYEKTNQPVLALESYKKALNASKKSKDSTLAGKIARLEKKVK